MLEGAGGERGGQAGGECARGRESAHRGHWDVASKRRARRGARGGTHSLVTSISRRLNGEPDPDADMTREPRTRWSTRGPRGRTGVEHPALEHERRVRRISFSAPRDELALAGGALERVFDARVERLRRTRVERRCCVWAGGLRLRASARACRGVCGAPFSPVGAKKITATRKIARIILTRATRANDARLFEPRARASRRFQTRTRALPS